MHNVPRTEWNDHNENSKVARITELQLHSLCANVHRRWFYPPIPFMQTHKKKTKRMIICICCWSWNGKVLLREKNCNRKIKMIKFKAHRKLFYIVVASGSRKRYGCTARIVQYIAIRPFRDWRIAKLLFLVEVERKKRCTEETKMWLYMQKIYYTGGRSAKVLNSIE